LILNFLYLKYFCDAVRLGGLTAAAQANFVTPSAVSQGITKLEQALDCALLAHHPNRFRLTPQGELAFQQMLDILKRTKEFQEAFSGDQKQAIGNLEFACTFSVGLDVVPSFLKRFQTDYPQVQVNFRCSGNLEEIKQMLRVGAIDFAVIADTGSFDFSGFEQQLIVQGTCGLYVSRKIKKNHEKSLKFIVPRNIAEQFKQSYFQKYGEEPEVSLEVRSWAIAASLAEEGLGIGYFPTYVASKKDKTLRRHELGLQFSSYRLCAIYPMRMRLRKSSEIFLSYFRENTQNF
jgi:DNA-binding transcriptional LysR family regulator